MPPPTVGARWREGCAGVTWGVEGAGGGARTQPGSEPPDQPRRPREMRPRRPDRKGPLGAALRSPSTGPRCFHSSIQLSPRLPRALPPGDPSRPFWKRHAGPPSCSLPRTRGATRSPRGRRPCALPSCPPGRLDRFYCQGPDKGTDAGRVTHKTQNRNPSRPHLSCPRADRAGLGPDPALSAPLCLSFPL